jgi:hypothetical protein
VVLDLANRSGGRQSLKVDHIVFATGYRIDARRLTFLSPAILQRMLGGDHRTTFWLIALLLAGLAVTHHLSSAYAAIYLGALARLGILRDGASRGRVAVAITAALGWR